MGHPKLAFLKSELTDSYSVAMDVETRETALQFIEDTEFGPGDGDMDIDWQTEGRGCYARLLELERLKAIAG